MMCSGGSSNINSLLLVKSEWDKAEEWLKKYPDERVKKDGVYGNY
jgi:hypothetical protein